jgi:hypothetical protein
MPTMIFYENPVPLNREQHRQLKLLRQNGQFGFARATNSVPLAASEIGDAMRSYPVVFVSGPEGQYSVAGLLGLRDNENLFIDADDNWKADAYVPAFVRRYPFVPAEDDKGQLTLCVDESFAGLSQTEGEPLFDEEGQDTKLLQSAVEFLKLFHAEMQRTRAFCERLAALGLLTAKTVQVQRDGKQETLQGLHMVDEQKLRELDDAQVLELFRNGYLPLIYAHLHSIRNLDNLLRLPSPAKPQPAS